MNGHVVVNHYDLLHIVQGWWYCIRFGGGSIAYGLVVVLFDIAARYGGIAYSCVMPG